MEHWDPMGCKGVKAARDDTTLWQPRLVMLWPQLRPRRQEMAIIFDIAAKPMESPTKTMLG